MISHPVRLTYLFLLLFSSAVFAILANKSSTGSAVNRTGKFNPILPNLPTSDVFNLTDDRVLRCDAARYGVISSRQSCVIAWESIPTDTQSQTWGPRLRPNRFDVPLPRRFLSRMSPLSGAFSRLSALHRSLAGKVTDMSLDYSCSRWALCNRRDGRQVLSGFPRRDRHQSGSV